MLVLYVTCRIFLLSRAPRCFNPLSVLVLSLLFVAYPVVTNVLLAIGEIM